MELSKGNIASLALLNEVDSGGLVAFVDSCCAAVASSDKSPLESGLDKVKDKQLIGSLMTLIVESTKHDSAKHEITSILEDVGIEDDRTSLVVKRIETSKAVVRNALLGTRLGFPKLVDVSWRVDYVVKSSGLEQIRQNSFIVCLTMQKPDQSLEKQEFACNTQELQDLLSKLRSACHQASMASGRSFAGTSSSE